ncbi:unnamed protein product [Menidia menidia]|uniref:(Atlantic silverside) hypothetical protein n=1 Tax=Menidia menidia TaxID=238744 RepID=A0A8S4B0H0_9TELE|nr:unnamed protein product [Menidia menidia]
MATANHSDEEISSITSAESDFSDVSDNDQQSEDDLGTDYQVNDKEPCKYYNRGRCKNGNQCTYLHACKYYLKGNCRYGSDCKLSHSVGNGARSRMDQPRESTPILTDGRYYQWQLNDGKGWKDVINDHIIEAQYSLPHRKSIKIYNTQYGAVSIDFNKIKVFGKRLQVRRLDDGNTEWIWYCNLGRKWIKYGDKDSQGNTSSVKSSDIEQKFQNNPTSSYTFSTGGETFEIRFTEMQQVGKNKKMRVTRRPLFRPQPGGARAVQTASALQRASLGSKPQWQFEGDSGKWHEFRRRQGGTSTECSITSDDIERKYQQNQRDTMTFQVNGQSYKLDFGAMIQTNLSSKHRRRIRRVLV